MLSSITETEAVSRGPHILVILALWAPLSTSTEEYKLYEFAAVGPNKSLDVVEGLAKNKLSSTLEYVASAKGTAAVAPTVAVVAVAITAAGAVPEPFCSC